MTVTLMPNMEALVSAFLRAQSEITALCGDRVYTAVPGNATYPLVRVTQFDDVKVTQRPLWVVRTSVQVEAYGGSKADAFGLASTAQSCIAERIEGVHTGGTVAGVTFGSLRDLPDDSFDPAKPRFLFSAYIIAHPAS